MDYIRHNFLFSSNKDNNIKLHDLESGERSGDSDTSIYPPLQMVVDNRVDNGPSISTQNYSHSFPTSDATSNIQAMASTNSMQVETSGGSLQLLLPDANQKRSWHQDQADSNKVRIVAQTSRIPTVVSICYL